MCIGHALNLREQSSHVAGATGGSKPWSPPHGTMVKWILSIRFEWIYIKEFISFQIYRCQNIIQQGNFCNIQILGIFVCQKHSKIKENITYGSTGLIERVRVGQEKLWPESFDSMDRTQATCNVHSCVGDVGPNSM